MSAPEGREKALDKVTKLLAKAASTNSQAEAEALAEKAQDMMSRWAIEDAELREASGDRGAVGMEKVDVAPTYAKVDATLLYMIAKQNHCRAIFCPRQSKHSPPPCSELYGFDEDRQRVKILYGTLLTTCVRLSRRYRNPGGQPVTTADRRAFRIGFVDGVTYRMVAARRQVEEDMAPSGSSTALVLVKQDNLVQDAVAANGGSKKMRGTSVSGMHENAYNSGLASGQQADIGQTGVQGAARRGLST